MVCSAIRVILFVHFATTVATTLGQSSTLQNITDTIDKIRLECNDRIIHWDIQSSDDNKLYRRSIALSADAWMRTSWYPGSELQEVHCSNRSYSFFIERPNASAKWILRQLGSDKELVAKRDEYLWQYCCPAYVMTIPLEELLLSIPQDVKGQVIRSNSSEIFSWTGNFGLPDQAAVSFIELQIEASSLQRILGYRVVVTFPGDRDASTIVGEHSYDARSESQTYLATASRVVTETPGQPVLEMKTRVRSEKNTKSIRDFQLSSFGIPEPKSFEHMNRTNPWPYLLIAGLVVGLAGWLMTRVRSPS